MQNIPYGKQHITSEDIHEVIETLKSDYLTQGPKIKEFEDLFAQYVGAKYAVAVANGTAALHLNALALDVKAGDKVITTPITFAASANCVRYCGGDVVFADIDPNTYLLDINSVRGLLESSPKGTYKGIIPVDFAGHAVDLEKFRELADEFDCWIIQDSCHSPGAFFMDSNGQKQLCGNGKFADLAIFSFHPVKHIATGEGGMITTNSETLYNKLQVLRTHGITRNSDFFENSVDLSIGVFVNEEAKGNVKEEQYPSWYMEMQTLGYNYRLTDFQAALGISQLKRADAGLLRRKEIAVAYKKAFLRVPQILDRNMPDAIEDVDDKGSSLYRDYGHAHHLYVIEVEARLGLYNYLRANNVFAQIHYIPVHLMPYYRQFGWKLGDFPFAEAYYQKCISLPMFPSMSDIEQKYVIDVILSFYGHR